MDNNLATVEFSTLQSSSTSEPQSNNVSTTDANLKPNLSPNSTLISSNSTNVIKNLQVEEVVKNSTTSDRPTGSSAGGTSFRDNLQSPLQVPQNLLTTQLSSSRPQSQQQSFQQPVQSTSQTSILTNPQNILELTQQKMAENMQFSFNNSEQQLLENAQNLFGNKDSSNMNKNLLNTAQRKNDFLQNSHQQMFRGPGEHPMGSSHVKLQQKASNKAKKEVYRFTNKEPLFAANWSNKIDFRLVAGTILENEQITSNQVIIKPNYCARLNLYNN